MDHGKIVSRGWDVVKNNKFLWGLGAIAALSGGLGSGSQGSFSFNNDFTQFNEDSFPEDGPFADFIRAMESADQTGDPAAIFDAMFNFFGALFILFSVLFLVGIILWVIGIIARAGLIRSVYRAEMGKADTFGDSMRGGMASFGRLFLMRLLLFIVILGIPLAIIIGIFSVAIGGTIASGDGSFVGVLFPVICLMVCLVLPFTLLIQFVEAYAFRGIVLQDFGVIESLKHGWQVTKDNLSDNLLLGVIFFLLSLVIGAIIGVIVGIPSFLFANPMMELFTEGSISGASWVSIIIGTIVLTALSAILSSIIVAWQSAGFTLAYMEFTGMVDDVVKEKAPDDLGYESII